MARLLRLSIWVLVGVLCSGCIDATTLVTVKKDGSGTIEESVYISKVVEQMLNEMTAAMGGKTASAPKTSKIDENKLKAKAAKMGEGVRFVSATEEKKADGSMGTREVYAFSDIRKLRLQSDPDTSALDGAAKTSGGPRDPGATARATKRYRLHSCSISAGKAPPRSPSSYRRRRAARPKKNRVTKPGPTCRSRALKKRR